MVWYRRCWRRMQEHFAAHGAGEFSLDAAMAWVERPTTCPNGTTTPDCSAGSPTWTPLSIKEGLCAVIERPHRCHQGQQASAAHNPALLIRGFMFS